MLRPLTALPLLTASLFAAEFPKPFNSEKGEPMPAAEVARTMKLPPGFKCVVFASEPDVQQPISMSWDARGRLWVAENYTYAENPARWDTNLRDRIIILEDKDGDGKHDERKVFWEGGTYLTSVEVGYGGAWVLNAGTLSFIPDRNGDDKPDGEPEVVLDGFNTKTIGHNIVNGLRWGPDGWLYGRHGITDTSAVGAPGLPNEKRVRMNCAIWRYHPTKKLLETVAHGGTNSWGHDWNAEGELFMINTVIGHLWHVIPGAYYRRMFGTHLNPYVYEIIEQTADHFHWDTGSEKWSDIRTGISNKTLELGGGHAHVGMLIYQGNTWPKEYHGAVLTCNLHGRRINMDVLSRQGCGYTAKHARDFMQAEDPWFRGIELLTGPDGNVFVADWSDTGECHDNDGVHRTSGRIYKIVYEGKGEPVASTSPRPDLKKASLVELHEVMIKDKNNWWSRMAKQQINERISTPMARPDPAFSETISTQVGKLRSGETEGLHILDLMDQADPGMLSLLLNHKFESVKVEGLELIRNLKDIKDVDATLLAEVAAVEQSGLVRLHIASVMQRLPLENRWLIAAALTQHDEDSDDRQQPQMIWYGIEPAVAADPVKGVDLVAVARIPAVRRLVARRIAEDIEKNPAAVEALVDLAIKENKPRGDVLAGMAAGLEGFSQAPKPKNWDTLAKDVKTSLDKAPRAASDRAFVDTLSLIFGSGRAVDELVAIVKNAEGDANARLNAFKSLTRSTKPELMPLVRGLVNDKVLGIVSRSALAAYDDPSIPKALLNPWPVRSEEQQAASVTTLVTRASYAQALLEAVKDGKVPKTAISPYQARAIRSLNDVELTKNLTAVWGELRDTPEAKKAELADWTAKLTPERLTKGDASKGKVLFTSACGACHKMYGEGGAIGPDLTGGDRHKLTYLLENILDPSAIVPADYRMSVFKLKDGRTITGVIPQQTERALTIQTPAERLTIEKSQIVEQQQLPMSLMPEGLLTALGEENVVHLIAYLQSLGPVR